MKIELLRISIICCILCFIVTFQVKAENLAISNSYTDEVVEEMKGKDITNTDDIIRIVTEKAKELLFEFQKIIGVNFTELINAIFSDGINIALLCAVAFALGLIIAIVRNTTRIIINIFSIGLSFCALYLLYKLFLVNFL